ncbi:MAG: 1-(5-phosphoribosyl)-5-((5-phosphoribosylamino)methylideneamino)imidazole-4-carboxamide isomerase, partial [Chloroflexi bacterium]|nr:1-(5-phosphoribosyl)-5-((5-phosphoribosylamino)methylideneamino)imidazole-4-carboxamide isomerase [Chloroflexota bacterium]
MFRVIPAIDLQGGRAVQLAQGDFERSTVFGDDPPAVARRWEAAGAELVHVVDLDGAREGGPRQLSLVGQIVRAIGVPVQLGGGLRSADDVEAAFAEGVAQVVLGTAAIEDAALLDASVERFGERIAVGIDARDGRVAIRGWRDLSDRDALGFARALATRGVRTIVYTDIVRDGMLGGPNVAATGRMVAAVPEVEVIASGGVSGPDDLLALA